MNSLKHSFFLVLIAMLLVTGKSFSSGPAVKGDSIEKLSVYGAFIDYSLVFPSSNFSKLPGVPSCCPVFSGGDGQGFMGGFFYDYPFKDILNINIRLGTSFNSYQFNSIETENIIVDGKSTDAKIEHKLDVSTTAIMLYPLAKYMLASNIYIHGGLGFDLIIRNHYDQLEEIIEPENRGTFLNGSRRRNDTDGNIEEISSINAALTLGFSYELPLSYRRDYLLAPEIFYSYGLSSPVKNIDWKNHNINLGFSLVYREPPPPPPPPPPPADPPDAIFPAAPVPPEFKASLDVVILDSSNNESKNGAIRIEDFVSHNMRPLLNYVFFDENSSELPQRYIKLDKEQAANFDLKSLQNLGALETYRQILNIVGSRMKSLPEAEIELRGHNSGTGKESGNTALSKARAETVRDYLNKTWNIEKNRIKISAFNLPAQASKNEEPGGEAENRRVEIISRDWSIIEQVITIDTMRVVNKINLLIKPEIIAEAGIDNWEITVMKNGDTINHYSGTDIPGDSILWAIGKDDSRIFGAGRSLKLSLYARDKLGQEIRTKAIGIPVEHLTVNRKRAERIQDREFEYYSLILFDYGMSKLSSDHRNVINFIKNRITPESDIIISGYTDKIGREEVNKKISEKRAKAVAKLLRQWDVKVSGFGESELLYDNTYPEGRFYCRTVKITVETPVKK